MGLSAAMGTPGALAEGCGAADALPDAPGMLGMLGGAGGVEVSGGGVFFFFVPGKCGSPNCAEAGGATVKSKATVMIASAVYFAKPINTGDGFISTS